MIPKDQMKKTDKQLERELMNELLDLYKENLREIRVEIKKFYDKYSTDGIMNYQDAQKFQRLYGLERNIRIILASNYDFEFELLNDTLDMFHLKGYLQTSYNLQFETDLDLKYSLIPENQIRESIQRPFGLSLEQIAQKHQDKTFLKVRNEITSMLIQGKTVDELSKNIAKIMGTSLNDAVRLARTEITRVRNSGNEKAYDFAIEKGINIVKQWVSTIDGKTRDSHISLDGQKADSKGMFHYGGYQTKYPSGFGVPSLDINCRCTTIGIVEDLSYDLRRQQLKGSSIIKNQTYKEYVDNIYKKGN